MAKKSRRWPALPEPLPVPIVDNHTHLESVLRVQVPGLLDDENRHTTIEQHLDAARLSGIDRVVNVGCDLDEVRWTDRLLGAETAQGRILGAVAIHPNEAVHHAGVWEIGPDGLEPAPSARHEVSLEDAIAEVARVARLNERVRAIGETGLDKFRSGPKGLAVQIESFRAHIALAKELDLALQIHDRDAHEEVLDILRSDGAPQRTVLHCFSGDKEFAAAAADLGIYCSFAGPVTYPANEFLRQAAAVVPRNLLLVETDAPYLTAAPHRGQPNSPYLTNLTVRALAEIRGEDLADLCTAISDNSVAVYGDW